MSLKDKIDHARSLSYEYELFSSKIIDILEANKSNSDLYLVYLDSEGNRRDISYSEFVSLVYDTAAFLQHSGLEVGDKIATISHNHWHTTVHYFAAWICGMVAVPVNLGEDNQRIDFILEKAEVKMAFIRDIYEDRIVDIIKSNTHLNKVKTIICTEDEKAFSDVNYNFSQPVIDNNVDAFIVFTSGTTGDPKGVVLSQQNMLEDCVNIAQWHEIESDTTLMCVLPIHHVNGTIVTLLTPFLVGAKTILNQKFSAAKFFDIVRNEDVDIVSTVPTLLQYLTSYYEENGVPNTGNLKHVICGAGPLSISVAEDFEETFGLPIIHGYGLSETTCYSCYLPINLSQEEHKEWMCDYGYPSIGVPIPANEMQIHDEKGKALEQEVRGEIVIRGVNVMKGYFHNDEANEKAFTNGWFRSGDEGFYKNDKKGRPYFFITGRIKELIIRGGINLAPLEIDEVINMIPGLDGGIAVGFENDWYGEEVGAYVKLKEGVDLTSEEIIEHCKQHLPYSKCPKVVVFGNEIPVTSTGKYQRRKVTHLFEQWKSVQFK